MSELPRVGIGYRLKLHDWIKRHFAHWDVLELTIDHYVNGSPRQKALIEDLTKTKSLVAHGIGLSVGTYTEPDRHYLERVAQAIDRLKLPNYSEHLAFTKVPGLALGNLIPLPRNQETADHVIKNLKIVQSFIDVPMQLENITYYFDYPDSNMTDAEFINLICQETGVETLLDLENLVLNGQNIGFSQKQFIDDLQPGLVKIVHVAGGRLEHNIPVDTHDQPVPETVLDLLPYLMERQSPDTIIVERDGRFDQATELLRDCDRIRRSLRDQLERHSNVDASAA